jgi:hypothetical protein
LVFEIIPLRRILVTWFVEWRYSVLRRLVQSIYGRSYTIFSHKQSFCYPFVPRIGYLYCKPFYLFRLNDCLSPEPRQ